MREVIDEESEKGFSVKEWINLIKRKANQEELSSVMRQKANKHDVEMQMKAIDIMHRQMVHVGILLVESCK